MTEGNQRDTFEMDNLLKRVEDARLALAEAINAVEPERFVVEAPDSESIKRALERTADDIAFYYGSLAARALGLPPSPCLQRSQFGSIREAAMSLQVAHRRFSNLLHDLTPADLDKTAADESGTTYTLRQVLEMVAAQYTYRAQQVQHIAAQVSSR